MIFPIAGNSRVKDTVEGLLSSGRMPHAIIIEGETGLGKRTLARFLAKATVCESENAPCGSCRNCHLADALTHPDILVCAPEEKKKNIAVAQIRDLRTVAYQTPHTAKKRVFIIEQAETMNSQAQNSLLKVLEEPPSEVLFLLLAESSEALLETVVSRCLTLSLFPPSFEEGMAKLKELGLDKDGADAMLREEKNNPGRVIARMESGRSSRAKELAEGFFAAIENGNTSEALFLTVPLEKDRPEAGRFTNELCELLVERVKKQHRFVQTAREYAEMFDAVEQMKETLETNINLSLYFTALVSKLNAVKRKR